MWPNAHPLNAHPFAPASSGQSAQCRGKAPRRSDDPMSDDQRKVSSCWTKPHDARASHRTGREEFFVRVIFPIVEIEDPEFAFLEQPLKQQIEQRRAGRVFCKSIVVPDMFVHDHIVINSAELRMASSKGTSRSGLATNAFV